MALKQTPGFPPAQQKKDSKGETLSAAVYALLEAERTVRTQHCL